LTAAFVGLIDGLVRHDVRRFGAGREFGFLYHRAKASLWPLVVLPWVVYLALPIIRTPAGHFASQRCFIRAGSEPDGGEFQKIFVAQSLSR